MHVRSQPTVAALAVGVGALSILCLSVASGVLASPGALGIGAAAGFGIAFRHRLPLASPSFRLGLVTFTLASAAFLWLSVQPGYIGV